MDNLKNTPGLDIIHKPGMKLKLRLLKKKNTMSKLMPKPIKTMPKRMSY